MRSNSIVDPNARLFFFGRTTKPHFEIELFSNNNKNTPTYYMRKNMS